MSKLNSQQWEALLDDTALGLIGGEKTPAQANALANVAGKRFSLIRLQMQYAKDIGRTPNIPMLGVTRPMPVAIGQ